MRLVAENLVALAALVLDARQAGRAVALLAATAALLESADIAGEPVEQAAYERTLAEAHAQAGEASWSTAWAAGQAMPLDEAIDYALDETLAAEVR